MTLCPLCRALPRFALQVSGLRDGATAQADKLFTTACWIIAALERTHPCVAHPRTLRCARRLAETLAHLIEEGADTTTPAAAMALEAAARKEIR